MSLLLVSESVITARLADVHLSRGGRRLVSAGVLPVWGGPSCLIAISGRSGR